MSKYMKTGKKRVKGNATPSRKMREYRNAAYLRQRETAAKAPKRSVSRPHGHYEYENEASTEWLELTSKLNEHQILFCEKYIETRDVKAAYIAAYPKIKPENAKASGYRLLRNQNILNYINMLVRDYGPVPRMNMNEIMTELERVAMADDVSSATKLKALVILGQAQGELTEKIEVTSKEFEINITDKDDEDY